MNKVINLSLSRKDIPVVFDVVQFATAPNIEFNISDYDITGANAKLYIKKPSGAEIYNACTISGQSVLYSPTTQSFAEMGFNECQLQIIKSGKILVSFIMTAVVHKNIIDGSAVESQSEFTALQQALMTVQQYDERITANTTGISELNSNTVKKNGNQSIDGNLSTTGSITTRSSYMYIGNDDSENGYNTLYFRFTRTNYTNGCYIRAYERDENGSVMTIRPGATLIAGGGEFATNYYVNHSDINSEETIIGADSVVRIITNYTSAEEGETVSKGWTFSKAGNLSVPSNGKIDGVDVSEVGKEIFNVYGSMVIPNKTLTSGTSVQNIGSFQLPAGADRLYLAIIHLNYSANSNGRRAGYVSETDTGSGFINLASELRQAVEGGATTIRIVMFLKGNAEAKTFYVNGLQNSGAELTVSTRVAIISLR